METEDMDSSSSNDSTTNINEHELSNLEVKAKLIQNEFKISDKVGRSKVWEIFGKVESNTGEEIANIVACRKCLQVYKFTGNSTSNLVKHKCYVISKCNDSNLEQKIDVDVETKKDGIRLLTLWTIENCRPFKMVEDTGLKKFSDFLIATGAKYGQHVDVTKLLPHPTAIVRNVGKLYNVYAKKLKTEICEIKNVGFGLISDIWTDNYLRTTYLSLTIHFVRNGKLISRLLGIKSMESERCISGPIIITKAQQLLKEFDCALDEQAIIVTDRSSNMVTAFRNFNRINCINHLLDNVLEKSMEEVVEVAQLREESAKLITFLKKSDINSSLRTSLKSFSATRWNGIYYMISSIERNWDEIMAILQEKNQLNRINNINLECITAILKVLELFEESSKILEDEKNPTLHLTIVHIYRLKKSCMPNNEDVGIAKKLKESLHKLIESFVFPNMTIHHKMALFLFPPANKLAVFDENEKFLIKTECKRLMKCYINDISNQQSQSQTPTSISAYNSAIFMDFLQPQQTLNSEEEKINSELRVYEATNVIFHDHFDILQWWHLNQTQFPTLYKTSCKILAVPASSVASERVFSKARLLISEKRSLIGFNTDSVNEIMFLNTNVEEHEILNELEQVEF